MKKKLLLFVSFLAGLLFLVSTPTYASKLPKGYGIAKTFTTPKATRGTWYYREKGDKTISKVKITAHSVDGKKLYVPSQKFFEKMFTTFQLRSVISSSKKLKIFMLQLTIKRASMSTIGLT